MSAARPRAVLVEDSPTQLAHLARVLGRGGVDVVAEATTAPEAVAAVERHSPDVAVMDLDIPGGGGQLAIEQIMAAHPVPILVLSATFDERTAAPAVAALAAGAVEAVPKPREWTESAEAELARRVRLVSGVHVIRRRRREDPPPAVPAPGPEDARGPVVGIVASTGGPNALAALLTALRPAPPPVLVVQHIHASFVEAFSDWLGRTVGLSTRLAEDGLPLSGGCVLVAPAGRHLVLDADRRVRLRERPDTLHRPSGDLMLASLAEHAGRSAVGVVLTGMGSDGARGLLAVREAGGSTYAQDEASSTVFGMPRAAQLAGAADRLLTPEQIGARIARAARR